MTPQYINVTLNYGKYCKLNDEPSPILEGDDILNYLLTFAESIVSDITCTAFGGIIIMCIIHTLIDCSTSNTRERTKKKK